MQSQYSLQSRAERLIAGGRAVLTGFSLLAISLDPSEPSIYAQATYAILAGYFIYAFLLTIVAWHQAISWSRFSVVTHAIDLVVFAVIVSLTEGPSSPFFVYFVFLLVCSTLRWQWRGTLWTAVAALSAVVVTAWYPTDMFRDPNFELNRFIIRIVYLTVVATLLGSLGAHEQKLRSGLAKLAAWPRSFQSEVRVLTHEILEHAASILDAPRMLLVWEEGDEPWLHLASWSPRESSYTRESPAAFGTIVAEALADTSFFCSDTSAPQPEVVQKTPSGLQKTQVVPLQQQLQERFTIGAVLSVPMKEEGIKGYLLALDKPRMSSDDLELGEIIAHEAATRLDHLLLLKHMKETVATEERIHLARDLHDGLLQSLTGAALQLETVYRLMKDDPETSRKRLKDIQHLISAEQRDLRSHIRELKPSPHVLPEADTDLVVRLEELAGRINRHWGLHVELNVQSSDSPITKALAQEIYFIVHESLINAARHAAASVVHIAFSAKDNRVRIAVTDNGRGFPFRGSHDHAALAALHLGPVTLRERIISLGGFLTITSGDSGAHLEITLPLTEHGG